jgi:glycosyltransferase involved in cell wall biosynthesis
MLSVTVVIPTYNGARYVEAALRSVFAQSLPPQEVVVVDDASADDTLAVVAKAAAGAPVPVRALRLPRNSGGPARPINTGVASARGELIAVLDQDDTFKPAKLETQARALSDNPRVALAAGLCGLSDESAPDRILNWQLHVYGQLAGGAADARAAAFPGKDTLRALLRHGNFLLGYPAFMFRAADWRAKGGVDERLRVASDYDLLCWLCTRGDVAIQPSAQYVRREHDANVSNNQQNVYLDTARVRARYLVGQRWLLDDRAYSRSLRGWFDGFSHALREAGNYRGAWECNRLAARAWGWDGRLLRAQGKLPLHWLWRRLTRRPPVYNDQTRPRTPARVAASPGGGPV